MKEWLKKLAFWLTIIGGIVWGLTVFNWNPVEYLPYIGQKIVYGIVGVSAVLTAFNKK
jgi:uncharacterized membrane protein YuzA (DUF378 family)